MLYELWDVKTANIAGEYLIEADALADIYRAVQAHGRDVLAGYALLRDDGEHDPELIAADAELVALAERQHALTPTG